MWNLFNCYLSGRHDYGMWCDAGAIFLRCVHCGKRSSGWAVAPKPVTSAQRAPIVQARVPQAQTAPVILTARPTVSAGELPLGSAAAS
jgi:hypothetical protein